MKRFGLLLITAGTLHAAVETTVLTAPGPIWNRHIIDNTSIGADGVKVGDLNCDGLPDLVTGWEQGGEVRAYLHPGHARVRDSWPRVLVGRVGDPEDAIFADLDGDGRLEVISCTEGRTRTVFRHRFEGDMRQLLDPSRWITTAFPATAHTQSWMQAIALDLDARHGPDLVLSSKGPGATMGWLQCPSNANDLDAWQFHPIRNAGWIMSPFPHDLDNDGDPDVVLTDRKGARSGVFWLENPGPQANRKRAPWQEHSIGSAGREVMFADLADLNKDGLLDVAVAVKPVEVLLFFQRQNRPWLQQTLDLRADELGDAKAVKAADLDNDGLTDLLFTCENAAAGREGIFWLSQQPGGSWKRHPLGGPAGVKFDLMQVLDLDADGDLDVITCEEVDQLGVVWYENPHRHKPEPAKPGIRQE